MRKLLLTAACVATAASMLADGGNCGLFEGFQASRTSPDGTWIVGMQVPNMTIRNMETGKVWEMVCPEDDWKAFYNAGNGYCVANDGTIIGGRTIDEAATWVPTGGELGTWTPLPSPTADKTTTANSITPDGKYIVGSITNPDFVSDEVTALSIPAIWTRNDDGTYGNPVVLPYPDKDWSGRTPQYCIANCVSDDGTIVVGLMIDYFGTAGQPFVCNKDDKGEWTMKLLCSKLLNPNDVKMPEYPGEIDFSDPTYTPEQYMSQEKGDEYMADYDAWLAQDEPNPAEKPDPLTYMTAEEKAAYEKAIAEYKDWEEKFDAYQNAVAEVTAEQTSFAQNLIYLTPDGKHFLASTQKADPNDVGGWMPSYLYSVMLYNLADDTYKEASYDLNLTAYQINNDLDIIACQYNMATYVIRSYIALKGDLDNIQPIEDYYKAKDEKIYEFMEKNLLENVFVDYIEKEDGEFVEVFDDILVTGVACGPFDLSWIALSRENQDGIPQTFILDYPVDLGVSAVEGNGFNVKTAGNGVLLVTGEAASIKVYNLSGALVFNGKGTGSIATGLENGIYIVKAVSANGAELTVKATL